MLSIEQYGRRLKSLLIAVVPTRNLMGKLFDGETKACPKGNKRSLGIHPTNGALAASLRCLLLP